MGGIIQNLSDPSPAGWFALWADEMILVRSSGPDVK